MLFSILHRMILWELTKVFVLSLLGITGILLMAGIVAEASQRGFGPAQIIAIIPFLIPSTLPYTIPATTLFATCVVYGRLAHDNEILAIRAAGINLMQVVWPGVFLGLTMSTTTMALYYRIIPYTHHVMRTMFLKDMEEFLYAMLNKDQQINHPKLTYAMFVRKVQGRNLIDAIFKRRDAQGNYDLVAWAREADLKVDLAHRQVDVHMRLGEVYKGTDLRGDFMNQTFTVPLPENFGNDRPPSPRDRSWQEILRRIDEVNRLEEETATKIALNAAPELMSKPPELQKHLSNLKEMKHFIGVERNSLRTELYMRPALSFGCLFFVLVGCPVGIWLSKSDYLSAFITCFLPIVLIYYPILLCGTNLAKEGKVHPLLMVWAANGVIAAIAVVLYSKLLRN